jgi:hypothetical protein
MLSNTCEDTMRVMQPFANQITVDMVPAWEQTLNLTRYFCTSNRTMYNPAHNRLVAPAVSGQQATREDFLEGKQQFCELACPHANVFQNGARSLLSHDLFH